MQEIQKLKPQVEKATFTYRGNGAREFDEFNPRYWCDTAFGDALVRVRQFIEQNFLLIEPMGLMAVTRYMVELSIWLNLFRLDERYGLVYYYQLIDTQLKYYKDTESFLQAEIRTLREMEEFENKTTEAGATDSSVDPDAICARKFLIFSEDAKTRGFSFQRYLVETKKLPQIRDSADQIQSKLKQFRKEVPKEVLALIPDRWNWKTLAIKTDLVGEYNYIYTQSSKLLHATPSSLTTDQKNLQKEEIYIYLRYFRVKVQDLLDISR